VFLGCTLTGGCPSTANCVYPSGTTDPIASKDPSTYDIYDACIMAGLAQGFHDPTNAVWQGKLLKGDVLTEAGQFNSTINNSTNGPCGGQNCGMWAISAGRVSGDSAPGPCGSSATDPFTGQVDYSHSYGLFQDTPACEGTFLLPNLPSGYKCTGTGKNEYSNSTQLPFSASDKYFYCESATGNGVMNLTGTTVKGVIDAVTDPTDPYYSLSIFNPAYNLFVHVGYTLANEYQTANRGLSGCTPYQLFYNVMAYWLTGNTTGTCALPAPKGGCGGSNNENNNGYCYVQTTLQNYQMIYGAAWPYPFP
jgi:hypothetical protein